MKGLQCIIRGDSDGTDVQMFQVRALRDASMSVEMVMVPPLNGSCGEILPTADSRSRTRVTKLSSVFHTDFLLWLLGSLPLCISLLTLSLDSHCLFYLCI